jgi:GNAT superfamily N-acetyltransferase
MNESTIQIVDFGNSSSEDKKSLKRFVNFHWKHYADDKHYIPLLDYEYLGFSLIGIKGFFEKDNLFFKHAEMRWFLAIDSGCIVGRCIAFMNHNHNQHWNDKTGFFGLFESIDDPEVAGALLDRAAQWLKDHGAETMRGPVNLPVNEATPGIMTGGFDSRPVMYYHYNKPYYEKLLLKYGLEPVKRVLSWEIEVKKPLAEKVQRLAQKIIKRYHIKIEKWGDKPISVRKEEMLTIYNEAWHDNWGFVPFTQEEFYRIIDDMMLIMDKKLFAFIYVKDEVAAFFGAVPNVTEKMVPLSFCKRCELLRALKMILGAKRTQGIRLGYLGVRPKYRRLGLDGVMIWKQKEYVTQRGYDYSDVGWVLEDNVMVTRMVDLLEGQLSKTYTVYEKQLR